MGDHENGSAVPRFAFQFFCNQAHIPSVKSAGRLIKDPYPAAGKRDDAGDGKPLLLPAGQGGRVRISVVSHFKDSGIITLPCFLGYIHIIRS